MPEGSARASSFEPWSRACAIALVLALASACDGAGGDDAGTTGPDAGGPFVLPRAPALPVFAPCPAGWAEVDSGEGFLVCEPPSGAACAPGTERFVDQAECAPVGGACPAGEWAAPPDGARAVYVRPGALGGDGTEAAPYGSIQTAITRAPPGAAVLLARGTYDEAIDVYGGLRVIGACAAETILAPSVGNAAVRAAESGIRVEQVTLRPAGEVSGVNVTGELALRAVVIEGASDDAVLVVDGGVLEADEVVFRDSRAPVVEFGRGLTVADGRATLRRAIIERCPGSGILVGAGGEVTARAIVVRDSGQGIRGRPQLIAQGVGGRLDLADSVVEDAEGTGLFVTEDGLIEVDQVVVRRLRPLAEVGTAGGVFARARGRLEASRLRVVDTAFLGLGFAEGSTAQLEDTYIARVRTTAVEGEPIAIGLLYSGPELSASRIVVRDIALMGIQVERGMAVLEDLSVARTGVEAGVGHTPMGVAALDATLTLRAAAISTTHAAGVHITSSTLVLEDVLVEETPGLPDGRFGRGIDIASGQSTLSRVLVRGAREVGLHASRLAVVTADELRIVDTRGRDCQATTCADTPGGTAIAVVGATLTAERFELDGARLCGAMIAGPAELDLRSGSIRGATVGACVQVDGYDLSRLTDDVAFTDNGIAVDATDHAVPAPTDPLGSLDL